MFIIRYNKIIITVILIGFVVCVFSIPNLKFDYNLKSFLNKNDPNLEFFRQYSKEFVSDENLVIIITGIRLAFIIIN